MSGNRRTPLGVRRRENSDGSTSYQARWRDRAGKQHSATFDSAREANDHLETQRRRMRMGSSGDPTAGRVSFGSWWLTWQDSRQVAPSTMARDLSYGRNHILPRWGGVWLADIIYEDVLAWNRSVSSAVAPATANKIVTQFKACLTAAVDADRLPVNPAAKVKAARIPWREAVFLDGRELARLEDATDEWWRLVVPFMADTALRIGEVSALRVRDLDLTRGIVTVRSGAVYVSREVSGRETRRIEGDTKTVSGVRTVPTLTVDVANRVAAQIAERHLGPQDLLFTGPRGGALTPRNWRERVFKPAVDRAGLTGTSPTPHSLRHSAIAQWIDAGTIEPLKLARWAGHAKPATLYGIYGHLLERSEEEVRAALGDSRRQARQAKDRGEE